jgi:AcrR family transcriptional regulator
MPPLKERKRQLREAAIIAAAARLIDRVGYTHMTMDMLAEEVGIAKATLYQHFKSKEEVVTASTRRALDNLEQFMSENRGTAIEQLQAIMRYMMQSNYDADGFPRMVMHDEVLHLFTDDVEIRAKFQKLNTLLFSLLHQGKQAGAIAPDLPNEVIITMMMNVIQAFKGSRIYPAQSQEIVNAYTIRIFFKGILP